MKKQMRIEPDAARGVLLHPRYQATQQQPFNPHTFEGGDGLARGARSPSTGRQPTEPLRKAASKIVPYPTAPGARFIPRVLQSSNWASKTLYEFQSRTDGWAPNSPLTL